MDYLQSFLQQPVTWLFILGVFDIIVVIKLSCKLVARVTSLVFSGIALYKVYLFLMDKL